MEKTKQGTATGAQRAELRLLLKRMDAERREDVLLDVNPDDPDLSAEDVAGGIKLLTRLLEEDKEKPTKMQEWRDGALGLLFLVLSIVGVVTLLGWLFG